MKSDRLRPEGQVGVRHVKTLRNSIPGKGAKLVKAWLLEGAEGTGGRHGERGRVAQGQTGEQGPAVGFFQEQRGAKGSFLLRR